LRTRFHERVFGQWCGNAGKLLVSFTRRMDGRAMPGLLTAQMCKIAYLHIDFIHYFALFKSFFIAKQVVVH
jgi:hypothetical protein